MARQLDSVSGPRDASHGQLKQPGAESAARPSQVHILARPVTVEPSTVPSSANMSQASCGWEHRTATSGCHRRMHQRQNLRNRVMASAQVNSSGTSRIGSHAMLSCGFGGVHLPIVVPLLPPCRVPAGSRGSAAQSASRERAFAVMMRMTARRGLRWWLRLA